MTTEQFDAILDKAVPWDLKDVEALARKAGLTAKDLGDPVKAYKIWKTR